jgi:hypothetical protein
VTEHPKSQSINFSHLRLLLVPKANKIGPLGNDELFHRAQVFLQENNLSSLREAARLFVSNPDALADRLLHVAV